MVKEHPPRAAVYAADDPRAVDAARVVPDHAALLTVGRAVLGYVVGRRGSQWSLDRQRLAEIENLILMRHAPAIAVDTDDGAAYAEQAARHLHDERALRGWCRRWTPLLPEAEIASLAASSETKQPCRADTIARRLGVTAAERAALGLKTIGAVDLDRDDRAAARRDRQREWHADRRRAAGRKQRAEYEAASISRHRPWELLGISRATFYRRRRQPAEPQGP